MQQDIWTNTKTQVTHGITGPLGSPRGWLRRALDVSNLDDTTFHATSITPPEISVAAIWYLPVDKLPQTGSHRELIRRFSIPDPQHMVRSRQEHLQPAIGIAAAVPIGEVMHWLKVYRDSGAAYTWWKSPENKSVRASVAEKPRRRQLDHATIYAMLDRGMTPTQISKQLDIPTPNIDYVKKKWMANEPPTTHKPPIDVDALRRDYLKGLKAPEIAEKYGTSESYVYRMMRGVRGLAS